ncbi:lytic polysaccharide monooxygenase [Taibaiella koreensis]|uniref:lytic polysaccharide monooxygenase n=1 Tax=Taibaiella koreensis TaxID=1268548 RepID=UPI0013C2C5EB|nr:lytic polysaccharide monooxygenase [Taibaiella koreensis]
MTNFRSLFSVVLTLFVLVVSSAHLFAHGYVMSPASRGYQGSLDKAAIGYNAALALYGRVINEPGSLEAPKGFPGQGPANGRIASANGSIGGDNTLDIQTATRWKKTNITTGSNAFIWKYSAYHATAKWHYYMTTQGWNPDQPLSRQDLELIGEVIHNGTPAQDNVSHQIVIPANRQGYHIILAVWDVEDTPNAFYNVIDVNVQSSTGVTPPATPTGLTTIGVTSSSAKISWTPQTDAAAFTVYRNGMAMQNVTTPEFEDIGLTAGTSYTYEIQATNANGLSSQKSVTHIVITNSQTAIEKPTAPAHLHAMNITESAVSLMWMASTHTQGIKRYEVYENGIKVAATTATSYLRTGLSEDTEYSYTVRSIAQNDEISDQSNVLIARTDKTDDQQSYCGEQQYSPVNAYPTAHTKVFYDCRIWKNKWYANPNEIPGVNMVWEELSVCTEGPGCQANGPVLYCGAQQYSHAKVYATAGTKVFYACKIWKNKWYANPGEAPGSNNVWEAMADCNEGAECAGTADKKGLTLVVAANLMTFVPETNREKIVELYVYNTNGVRVLHVKNCKENGVDVSTLIPGIYIVKIIYEGGSVITKKISKL